LSKEQQRFSQWFSDCHHRNHIQLYVHPNNLQHEALIR